MKRIKPSTLASLLALLSGAAGLTMRIWLFRSGIDERGLFLSSHPAMYLLPGLAVVFLAADLLFSLKVVPDSYQKRFPALSPPPWETGLQQPDSSFSPS